MSVRAYRQITEPKLAKEATFDLWSNLEILEKLQDLPETRIMGGEWTISHLEVCVAELERLLAEPSPFDSAIVKAFQNDIHATKANGEEYISYHCY